MTAWLPSWCREFWHYGVFDSLSLPWSRRHGFSLLRAFSQFSPYFPSLLPFKQLFLALFFLLSFLPHCETAWANNLQITNVELVGNDPSAGTVKVEFDISWDNSWRKAGKIDGTDVIFHDAVWVFVKYSTDSGTTWKHATLKSSGTNPSEFSTGSGTPLEIIVPADKKGAFLRRATATPDFSSGSVLTLNVQLVWDVSTDNVSGSTIVRVFGIEMVYVPTANFYIGDGDGTNESTYAFHTGTGNQYVQITSTLQSDIRVDANTNDDTQIENTGIGIDGDGGIDTDDDGTVDNSSFPTGYKAFYAMKYELTQGQYKDFLNTLTRTQQNNRTASDVSTDTITNTFVMSNTSTIQNRNAIQAPGSGNGTTAPVSFHVLVSSVSKEDRAANYLSWMDLCAYADWAALRPLTELEFEKMARGANVRPWQGQYAWGWYFPCSSMPCFFLNTPDEIIGTENGTETVRDTTSGWHNYYFYKYLWYYHANVHFDKATTAFTGGDGGTGPLRAGIFAASTAENSYFVLRYNTGAGAFGHMELSGNVWERVVTVGNSTGRSFQGTHGDGELTTTSGYEGNATNTDWPGIDATTARGVTGATGSGFRGGAWDTTFANRAYLAISNRNDAAKTDTTRGSSYGGRLGRTAPS